MAERGKSKSKSKGGHEGSVNLHKTKDPGVSESVCV